MRNSSYQFIKISLNFTGFFFFFFFFFAMVFRYACDFGIIDNFFFFFFFFFFFVLVLNLAIKVH